MSGLLFCGDICGMMSAASRAVPPSLRLERGKEDVEHGGVALGAVVLGGLCHEQRELLGQLAQQMQHVHAHRRRDLAGRAGEGRDVPEQVRVHAHDSECVLVNQLGCAEIGSQLCSLCGTRVAQRQRGQQRRKRCVLDPRRLVAREQAHAHVLRRDAQCTRSNRRTLMSTMYGSAAPVFSRNAAVNSSSVSLLWSKACMTRASAGSGWSSTCLVSGGVAQEGNNIRGAGEQMRRAVVCGA